MIGEKFKQVQKYKRWRFTMTKFPSNNKPLRSFDHKNVLISEKGKKLVDGLLNEFHQSESDGDIENNLLCIKNKIISKKQEQFFKKELAAIDLRRTTTTSNNSLLRQRHTTAAPAAAAIASPTE
uniref:Uncharacterized protein n=1 Tax=Glossina morsitans morsitans TaxID=37546 RepID=A0A1B0F9R0_GLOMM